MTGDFTGFSFNGIHSSQLGITRVSSGDRYKEELQPEVRDKTVEIPGNDGDYYYWSTYGPKTHTIDIAFDSMTEKQFRQLRQLFATKKVCELIFDERPYKVYYAKIESPIELEYVCFDEEEYTWNTEGHRSKEKDSETGEYQQGVYIPGSIDHKVYTGRKRRIYKGEGTITLISNYPFARQLYRILEHYYEDPMAEVQYTNVDEWRDSSGILDRATWEEKQIDQPRLITNTDVGSELTHIYTYAITTYNPGDLNVGFCLYIPFDENGKISPYENEQYIRIHGDTNVLVLKEITRRGNPQTETGIIINTVHHLIEGVNFSYVNYRYDRRTPSWEITGTLYNDAIVAGDFPYIKRKDWNTWDEWTKWEETSDLQGVYISCKEVPQDKDIVIYYNYLYF